MNLIWCLCLKKEAWTSFQIMCLAVQFLADGVTRCSQTKCLTTAAKNNFFFFFSPTWCMCFGTDLFSQEGRLVGAVCGRVAGAPHGLHVGDGHAQDGQLVRFPSQSAASRHHVWQFRDVLGHFVASSPLNFTVVLSRNGEILVRGLNKRQCSVPTA